nr:hypothetical protein GCM10020093_071480 [Planobispora longispora]
MPENSGSTPDDGEDIAEFTIRRPFNEQRLLKSSDFDEAIKRDLQLPDVDTILKDLQREYGIRIGLSPNLIRKLEAIKESACEDSPT